MIKNLYISFNYKICVSEEKLALAIKPAAFMVLLIHINTVNGLNVYNTLSVH